MVAGRLHDQGEPMSLRIVTANTAWQMRGDADYIAHLCDKYDVVLIQEAKDTHLAKVAPEGWTVLQDTTDKAHMGSAILVRDSAARVVKHELLLGVRPFLPTGKRVRMLTRYLNAAHLEEVETGDPHFVMTAHDAPGRFSLLQIPFWRRVKKAIAGHGHTTIGTDANAPVTRVAKRLGLTPHAQGIVGLMTGSGVKVANVDISSWGIKHKVTDHPSVGAVVTSVKVDKPAPPPAPEPTPQTTVEQVIAAARGEIGYHEGRSGGHWNNKEKYAADVPGMAWVSAGGYPWCALFVSWCFNKVGALDLLPGGATASVAHIRDAAKQAKRFSEYPAIGAVVLYGQNGDAHTGTVVDFGRNTITVVEGNTNDNGSPEGDGVYLKTRQRRDSWVYGYAYPTYPEGIVSADPAWKGKG
jgi:hypothetical protein